MTMQDKTIYRSLFNKIILDKDRFYQTGRSKGLMCSHQVGRSEIGILHEEQDA